MIEKSKNKMMPKAKTKVVKKKDALALGINEGDRVIQCPSCGRMVQARRIKTCSNCAIQKCDRCGGHAGFTECECSKDKKNA